MSIPESFIKIRPNNRTKSGQTTECRYVSISAKNERTCEIKNSYLCLNILNHNDE